MLLTSILTYRRIDPELDADLVVINHHAACLASFGNDDGYEGRESYLKHLSSRIEEFPDGHVLAMLHDQCIGQLELQVPYGLPTGYVNLFYVSPSYRRLGFGRMMHTFAEHYFRAWEASRIELDVSPTNRPAVRFYLGLGYRFVKNDRGARLRRMVREIPVRMDSR